jgi:hypothetical protein
MAECAAMSAAQRLVGIGVAVLAVVAIVIVGLNVSDGDGTVNPSHTPALSVAESPSPSEAAATGEPSPAGDDEMRAALAEIEEQVIAIRGLPAVDLDPELLTRAAFQEELLASFEEDYPPEEVAEDNASLRALGLLGPDQDIAELQLQLLGDQVLGFYDDEDRRMVVVTDEGLDAVARFTYAHEYTHALQDAAFDLSSLETDAEGQDDRGLARVALIEGDATVTMLAWGVANLTPDELFDIQSQEPPDTEGIPSWLVEQTAVFPYNDGLAWAGSLVGDPFTPDFAPVDAAFDAPPDSTEQIVHLDKWDPRETPIAVDVVDLAAALGTGWTEVDDTPIGEAFLRMMLEYHGIEREVALEASDGWGGDRVVVAIGADEAFAVAWRLAWDTPADAEEFVAAYTTAIGDIGFPASVTQLDDGEVLVAHGSSAEILRRTVDAADG